MTACVTRTKIEYIYEKPDVNFPLFPSPESVILNDKKGIVEMPLWYWEKIAEYKIQVDAIEKYFYKLEKIQEGIESVKK